MARLMEKTNETTITGSKNLTNKFAYILFCCTISILLSVIYDSFSIFICDFLGIIITLILSKNLNQRAFIRLFLVKCVAVLFVILVYEGAINRFGSPYYNGGSDDIRFETSAQLYVDSNIIWPWQDITIGRYNSYGFLNNNSSGFVWLLSWLMRMGKMVGNYHTMSFRVLNINLLLSIGALVYSYMKKKERMEEEKSLFALTITCLFPNALFVSSYVFRDTISALCIFAGYTILCDVFNNNKRECIIINNKFTGWITLTIVSVFAYYIRSENVYIIFLFFGISYFFRKGRINSVKLIIGFLSVVIFFYIISLTTMGRDISNKITFYQDYYISTSRSNSIDRIIFQMDLFPIGWLIRLLFCLTYPSPIMVTRIDYLLSGGTYLCEFLVSLGSCLQLFTLPYLFKSLQRIDICAISFVGCVLVIAISTFSFRHMVMLYPFWTILTVREYYGEKSDKGNYKFYGLLILGFVFLIYYIGARG